MVFSIAGCRETAFSIAKRLHYGQNYPRETQAVCGGGGGNVKFLKYVNTRWLITVGI